MATTSTHLILLSIAATLFLQTLAQTAPASASLDLIGILDKAGQYTTFIRLLNETQAAAQIKTQLNSSTDGMTILAPTDNAFTNLKAGTLNNLSPQQQVELVQLHVLPKYYTLANLLTVSNPVRTQSGTYGLNFTGSGGNQVNVSSGAVTTPINNALRQQFPLAVYQVDKVLLPTDMFVEKVSAPPPAKTPAATTTNDNTMAAEEPSAEGKSGAGKRNVEIMGLVLGLAFFFMGTS